MTTTRRDHLRRIMGEAWGWFRSIGGTFADALRTAWRAHRIRVRGPVIVHKVKRYVRERLSPLANTAALNARADARRAAWFGSKVATW